MPIMRRLFTKKEDTKQDEDTSYSKEDTTQDEDTSHIKVDLKLDEVWSYGVLSMNKTL